LLREWRALLTPDELAKFEARTDAEVLAHVKQKGPLWIATFKGMNGLRIGDKIISVPISLKPPRI
jgi:hypothetical protein